MFMCLCLGLQVRWAVHSLEALHPRRGDTASPAASLRAHMLHFTAALHHWGLHSILETAWADFDRVCTPTATRTIMLSTSLHGSKDCFIRSAHKRPALLSKSQSLQGQLLAVGVSLNLACGSKLCETLLPSQKNREGSGNTMVAGGHRRCTKRLLWRRWRQCRIVSCAGPRGPPSTAAWTLQRC